MGLWEAILLSVGAAIHHEIANTLLIVHQSNPPSSSAALLMSRAISSIFRF